MCSWLLLASLALAQDEEPQLYAPTEGPLAEETSKLEWSGYGFPIFSSNAVDGFGFGLAGEIFARPPDQPYGYRFKLSLSSWYTSSFNYTSQTIDMEYRSDKWDMVGRVWYQAWRNHLYAGVGGDDVASVVTPQEGGNRVAGPYVVYALSRRIGESSWKAYTQVYGRYVFGSPGDGSLMQQEDPLGANGALYVDLTPGVEVDTTDRWPLPISGVRAELDGMVGLTFEEGTFPLVGVHGEFIGWQPLWGEKLVIGGRLLASKTFGERPHFMQFVTGGRFRDELGLFQAFSGYGRLRTRGDGAVAAMLDVRPYFGGTRHPTWDFQFYASLFAETGILFDGGRPGPQMPTVGGGPVILFQRATQLRPFVAWGWRYEEPGGKRLPELQFALAVVDPL